MKTNGNGYYGKSCILWHAKQILVYFCKVNITEFHNSQIKQILFSDSTF